MATRFAPFATIKALSLATLARDQKESGMDDAIALSNAFTSMFDSGTSVTIQEFYRRFDEVFRPIALADSVSISEDFGTRPVYGIGEPTKPEMVPNNVSVRVSISRLTTDAHNIRDYAATPAFWYDRNLQRSAIERSRDAFGPNNFQGVVGLNSNRPFSTFLAISDIEKGKSMQGMDALDYINGYEMYEIVPVSYGTRYSSENAIIMTDVETTGRVVRLRELIWSLSSQGL